MIDFKKIVQENKRKLRDGTYRRHTKPAIRHWKVVNGQGNTVYASASKATAIAYARVWARKHPTTTKSAHKPMKRQPKKFYSVEYKTR